MKLNHFIIMCIAVIFVSCANNSNHDKNDTLNSDEDTITVKGENIEDVQKTDSLVVDETTNYVAELPIKEGAFHHGYFRAYISDPDTVNWITNVRKTPNGEVLLKLDRSKYEYIINITASQGRWFKVNEIEPTDSVMTIPGGSGWIHGSVIGFTIKSTRNVHEKPNKDSKNIEIDPYDSPGLYNIKLVDIEGHWVKAEWYHKGEKIMGWVEEEFTCGNPYTTCP